MDQENLLGIRVVINVQVQWFGWAFRQAQCGTHQPSTVIFVTPRKKSDKFPSWRGGNNSFEFGPPCGRRVLSWGRQ